MMKHSILLLFLLPYIAFGQATPTLQNNLDDAFFNQSKSMAWVDTTLEYCWITWDTVASDWENYLMHTYTYDNNVTEELRQIWVGSSWINTDKISLCNPIIAGLMELSVENKHLLYITDLLGRFTQPVPYQILIYRYSDGSAVKKMKLNR